MPELVSRQGVHTELDEARIAFHRLVAGATDTELRRASDGTRWTNQELLFHMLFGYLIARALLVLPRIVSHLPRAASRGFASVLNSATPLFDEVNYLGRAPELGSSAAGAWTPCWTVSSRRSTADLPPRPRRTCAAAWPTRSDGIRSSGSS